MLKINIKKDINLNKKYYISIIVVLAMIILAIIFIKFGLETEKNTKSIYQYKIDRKSDYEVLLKENDFYPTKTLPDDLYYASKSIDAFIINFEYGFKGSSAINTEYNYNITANLVGTVKDEYQNKEIWNKKFIILDSKSDKKLNTDTFLIKEKIDIDYEKYNNLVSLYEKTYGIKLYAVLKVRFNIFYYNINNEKIDDFIELEIPLTNTVTEVNKNYEDESIINIMPPTEKIKIREYIYYTIAGLFMITALIIFIVKISRNKMTLEEKCKKNLNHILEYYKDIIVTINNKPDFNNLKMMELTTLDDLIDVAEQNKCNIIHYKDLSKIDYLYAIVGEYVYCYKIENN